MHTKPMKSSCPAKKTPTIDFKGSTVSAKLTGFGPNLFGSRPLQIAGVL